MEAIPFGPAMTPLFDGNENSAITIPDDEQYSHTYANALTVACWICPMALNFEHTSGITDQFVHPIEKAVDYTHDAEWAMRLYNVRSGRPSRSSFYLFNKGTPVKKGAGAYMQFGYSPNDQTPVEIGRWLFLVGQGEPWTEEGAAKSGSLFYKQGVQAVRSSGDKYRANDWDVVPHNSTGPITIGGSIGKTWFRGAIAHVSLWNRLLTAEEVNSMWMAGLEELRQTACYRGY